MKEDGVVLSESLRKENVVESNVSSVVNPKAKRLRQRNVVGSKEVNVPGGEEVSSINVVRSEEVSSINVARSEEANLVRSEEASSSVVKTFCCGSCGMGFHDKDKLHQHER